MLYVIGGASCSGKTLLSRRAVSEKRIPYFPLDALVGALAKGAPELGIRYEDAFVERSSKMWPIVKHLFHFFFEEEQGFIIEGDSILPSQMHELQAAQKPIKCCFLGYTELTKNEKLALVRTYHQGDIDWTKGHSDEALLDMIDDMIRFSEYLKDECAKYDIQYFDISHDFEGVRNTAFEYLFSR